MRSDGGRREKIVLFANTDWYLYNFRRSLALELQRAGYDVLLLSPPGPYGAAISALGLRWQPIPMHRRSLNPAREAMVVASLARIFRRERPRIVHAFTIKCAVYGSLAARLARVPGRVSTVAGLGYVFTSKDARARTLRPVVQNLMRLALEGAGARLIVQNPDDQALLEQAGVVRPDRIVLIRGSGVDCERFVPRAASPRSGPLRVLLAARLLWDKGIAEYVEAARLLHDAGRPVRFVLAGAPDAGNPAAVPEAVVSRWVDDGLVDWRGHVEDMPALLADVDVAVLPSYREGLPRSLIEAAACGLPLVTTDVPGCREVVTDGVNGLLVPPRDARALAEAIARLDDDETLAQKLGAAARVRAVEEFDERRISVQTIAVYQALWPR